MSTSRSQNAPYEPETPAGRHFFEFLKIAESAAGRPFSEEEQVHLAMAFAAGRHSVLGDLRDEDER